MQKEIISNRQGISIMYLFIMGSTLVLGASAEAKQDAWIAIILAALPVIPIIAIYARVLSLFPGQNLYEILNIIFGRFFGRILSLFYIWYSFHLGVLVLRNFSEFINVVSLTETPQLATVMLMGALCIWVVKEGIEVLGRLAQLIMIILVVNILLVVPLSMTIANFDNIRPVLYNGIKPVISGAFSVFAFPFAETVLFVTVFNLDKERNNAYKIYYYAVGIGAFFVLLLTVRNVVVLGANFIQTLYFPSHIAVTLINIGNFLQRIEITVAITFIFSGFVKTSICLLSTCKGIDQLLKLGNYRLIAAPVGFMMMITSYFIYGNIMEMQEWAFKVYKYYALPFQVILPVIIWIVAEVKSKKQGRS